MLTINRITLETRLNPAPNILKLGEQFKNYDAFRTTLLAEIGDKYELAKVPRMAMATVYLKSASQKLVTLYWDET